MAINLENARIEIERLIRRHLVPWMSETFSLRDCYLKNVAFMTMEVQTDIPCNHEKTAAEQIRFLKNDLERLMTIRGENVEVDAWITKKGKVRIQFQDKNATFLHKWRVLEKEETEGGLRCKLIEEDKKGEEPPTDDYDQLFPKWWPNPDEPRWIIRDELAEWTREQTKKKTEEIKMANLMDIVKLVGKNEDIMLAVDGEEKEGTPEHLTAQMLAKHSCKQVQRIQDWEHSILLRVKE